MGRRIVKYLKNWLSGLLLVATSATAFSQNSYPVHVSVQVLPPYGVYLSDYYSGTRDRLIVTLLNRDQGQNVLQVKLRVSVKNGSSLSLRSRDELYYPVITLERGIPLRLTNSDLVPYLAPDRIAMNGYLQNGKLPVGMTEFSVQAFDHATGRPLSDVSTGRAWLEIKQPPMLDLPAKDELVASRTPQYIRFQWMPRHQGLASTMYEFTLKELPDNGAAPQSAYLYGNTVYQTQTRFTTINYTHLEPLLTPGKQYGWQVRAIALDGVDEIGMFENNGYSEVGWFRIGDNCPPVNVTAQAGYRKMTLQWQKLPEHMAFVVEYRLKSEHDFYEWTSEQTFDNEFIAYQLTPGYKYEYRVGAMGMTQQQPVFSPVGEITLPVDNEDRLAKCGMKPVIDFANQEPKENLVPGDIVIIGGDFPMTLTQVSPQGNGWYSGKGWITMPWIFEVDVAVKFSRLRINTDNRQIGGEVETETDPKASQIANLNELDYGGNTTTEARRIEFPVVKLDFTIPDIPVAEFDPEKGEVIIYDTNGEPHIVATQQNGVESVFPMIVEDKEGNKYQIDAPEADKNDTGEPGGSTTGSGSGGKQTLVVTPIKDIPGTFDTTKLNADGGIVVQFSRGGGEFAFDAGAEPWYQTTMLLRQYYAPFGTYGDNVDYVAAWKFILTGENDTVEARIVMGETDAANILFVLKDGTGIAARHDGGKWTLTLPAVSSGETYEVYAIYNGKNRQYTVGKLNVVSYGKQQRTVTLVPVDAQMNDIGGLERELNTIYKPYGISIKIEIDKSIYGNMGWDDGDRKLNLNGSGFFSKETGEMKALRSLYQRENTYKKDSYYIFVMGDAVAGEESDKELAVQGDMPRGKQFGYIFPANIKGELSRLVAHELGHGMFTLLHSFDANYSGDKYKTANLMDYASGTDLAAFQWNIIANPAPLTWFDSEEDSKAFGKLNTNLVCIYDKTALKRIDRYKYFYIADGRIIDLGDYKVSGFFTKKDPNAPGALAAILVENKIHFHTFSTSDDEKTHGFGLTEGKTIYSIGKQIHVITDKSEEAVRIFIDRDKKIITIEQNKKVLEEFSYEDLDPSNLKSEGQKIYSANTNWIDSDDYDILYEIAEIGQEFPGLYNSFVYKLKNDGVLYWNVEKRPTDYSREKLESTLQAFKAFKNAVDKLNTHNFSNCDDLVQHVRDNFQVTKGSDNLFIFPSDPAMVKIISEPFKYLTLQRKQQFVDLLHTSSFKTFQNVGQDVDAGTILAVIFKTSNESDSDAKKLIDYVADKGYLKHFVEDLHGYQYTTFMSALLNMALKNYNYANLQEVLESPITNPNSLVFNSAFFNRNKESFTEGGKNIELSTKRWFSGDEYSVKAKPYDPVVVSFVKDENFNDFSGNIKFKKGQQIVVPAIFAYELFWQDTKSAYWKTARFTAEVGLTAIGIGEVAWAIRAYRVGQTARATFLITKALSDLGVGFTDIYIQADNNLTEEQMQKWNKFVLLYSAGSFSVSSIDMLAQKYAGKAIRNQNDFFKFEKSAEESGIDIERALNNSPQKAQIEEVVGVKSGNVPSVIRQLRVKPSYKPLRTIYSKPNATTTFIGKWDEIIDGQQNGLQKVFNELSESDLNIYMISGKFEHPGGFNMLSIDNFAAKQSEYVTELAAGKINSSWNFDDYIWEIYNKPWLESALQRGDDIVIWSDPVILKTGFYKRELDLIQSKASQYGYDYEKGINAGTFTK